MTNKHPESVQKAYLAAKKTRERAYAPYSKFKVGAAIKYRDSDQIFTGHNIENVSFPAGCCAEPIAIYSAITELGRGDFEFMVVVADTKTPTAPCGICRQVLAEHVAKDFPIYLANLEGIVAKHKLSELLPHSFDELS